MNDHLAIWAAGIMGILTSFMTLLDATARVLTAPPEERAAGSAGGRRAQTEDPSNMAPAGAEGGGGMGGGGGRLGGLGAKNPI